MMIAVMGRSHPVAIGRPTMPIPPVTHRLRVAPLTDADRSEVPTGSNPAASRLILAGLAILLLVGLTTFHRLGGEPEPPPAAIAGDPLLVRGRSIFLERCVSCHGPAGRGDGPIARGLAGRPPRNLAEEPWKHGDRPEQVLAVLEDGVKDAQMPAWSGTYGPADLKAVAAYVYHLAGRPVPDPLRAR